MDQKTFLRRTAIPVLLAILLVISIQLIPQRLPEAILPEAEADYLGQLSLVEEGAVTQTVSLTAAAVTDLRAQLQGARAQNRGQAGDITGRHPLLYQLTFTPTGDGAVYELLLDPQGRLFAGGKLYRLQGLAPQTLVETLQSCLSNGEAAP